MVEHNYKQQYCVSGRSTVKIIIVLVVFLLFTTCITIRNESELITIERGYTKHSKPRIYWTDNK